MLHRKVVQPYSYWRPFFQKFLSTFENDELLVKKKNIYTSPQQKNDNQKDKLIDEVKLILNDQDLDYYLETLPKSILRRYGKACNGLYLISKNEAKLFCSMISKELLKNKSYVIEVNPGFGYLTQELLSAGIYPIHLYEKCDHFVLPETPLSKLILKHKDKLQLKSLNISRMWMLLLRDKYCNDRISEVYLQNIPHRDWSKDSYMQVILACEDRSFFTLLVHNFFNQTSLFEYGRPTFFVAVSSFIWKRLTAKNTDPENNKFYKQFNIMLHLFFDQKCLGVLPRDSFIPRLYVKMIDNKKPVDTSLIVLHFEAKRNAYDIIKKEDLKPFWFFLKYCLRSKNNKVIKEFEKLVPGCGPKLIQQNIHVFTYFKDLDPETLLHLFHIYKSWPEYCEVSFMPSDEIKKDVDEECDQEIADLDSSTLSNDELT